MRAGDRRDRDSIPHTGATATVYVVATWPVTLRRVLAWLDPWTFLWRWWRAWSTAPPPTEIQALLHAVETGLPLRMSVPD